MVQKSDANKARAVGRRKTASARVRITPGKGKIVINDRELNNYFTTKLLQERVVSPLVAIGKEKDTDVSVKVAGGGIRGQADAVCHGIARALVEWNEDFKPTLKAKGFMTRDSRAKERKKPGLHKARRAHQWRKR
ncbi:MAG: 30S ribosomal protein S9 [Candidatus Magasanikbacteria bacterium]